MTTEEYTRHQEALILNVKLKQYSNELLFLLGAVTGLLNKHNVEIPEEVKKRISELLKEGEKIHNPPKGDYVDRRST